MGSTKFSFSGGSAFFFPFVLDLHFFASLKRKRQDIADAEILDPLCPKSRVIAGSPFKAWSEPK